MRAGAKFSVVRGQGDRSRARHVTIAAVAAALVMLFSGTDHRGAVFAQAIAPSGIVADGEAVVTGFSGAQPPALIAPGIDPADKTYIDLAGPSARVIDLQTAGAPPQAQLLQAPKTFTVTASQVGQVFGVALDNASPPNIYVAATSAYGLPIVVPDVDGDKLPERVKQGAPNASFMPGLFGSADQGGGPGSIWRIDGVTGEVSLFANVMLNNVANSGPALGGLAFDAASNSLFVADRDTGMIHRFDMNGAERGRYDHGVQGRTAAGLPAVPFNPAKRLDITKPQFRSNDPATWAYAPPARRIFGLAVRAGRLYYAVADGLQIWSVTISATAFGADARREITVPPNVGATEISRITFDDRGRMLLAERAAPTGAYEFAALAQEGIGRVLRYARVASPPSGAAIWQPVPDQYAIGFPLQMRNGNGGVAIGYGYDAQGNIDRASCGGFIWSTGEQLRVTADPALAAQLAQGGPAVVNGLQGNDVSLIVPANVPPLKSYFVDYDDRFDDPDARGHLGDIIILRSCGRAGLGGLQWYGGLAIPGFVVGGPILLPPPLPFCPLPGPTGCNCPPGGSCVCPPGTMQKQGLQCCPWGQMPGPNGTCQSVCANGAMDPASLTACILGFQPFTGQPDPATLKCWDGSSPVNNGGSNGLIDGLQCPQPPNFKCPAGFVQQSTGGPDSTWSNGDCVPTQQEMTCLMGPNTGTYPQIGLDGQCHQDLCPSGSWALPIQQCCPAGTSPDAYGKCTACPPSQQLNTGGMSVCCPAGTMPDPGTKACLQIAPVNAPPKLCPDGKMPAPTGKCPPPPPPPPPAKQHEGDACFPGYNKLSGGCCLSSQTTTSGQCCPLGQAPDANKRSCVAITQVQPICVRGYSLVGGQCCANSQVTAGGQCCPAGQTPDADRRTCVAVTQPAPTCARGYALVKGNQCCLNSQVAGDQCCPAGQTPDANRRSCVPIKAGTVAPVTPVTPGTAVTPTTPLTPTTPFVPVQPVCGPGHRFIGGSCVAIVPVQPLCPGGLRPDPSGACPPLPRICPSSQHWDGRQCVANARPSCPADQVWDGRACVPVRRPPPAPPQKMAPAKPIERGAPAKPSILREIPQPGSR